MEGNGNVSYPDALLMDEEDCFVEQGEGGCTLPIDLEHARRCFAEMIILHEYPLSREGYTGLRMMTSTIQPLVKTPSLVKKDILQVYEEEKFKLTHVLDENESRVAITTDMWWTSDQNKGYMVVMGQYIDSSWNLQSRILSFTYVPVPHTNDVLTGTLRKILLGWNIDDRKLSTITLDNCSTNDDLMHGLLGRLDGGYLLLGSKLLHMRCGARILNLIVKDGLDVIKEGVEKIRDSVLYWIATPKRHETFVTWCCKLGVPFTKKLVMDCPNQWNSTYEMLETAWLYKDVFPRLNQKELYIQVC